ncbi:MAG: ATP synthase F1 subunit gamma [Oscillospiraceae bacterium]|nr:ATP synthase F1 subunit gamma [Oscillospiraceae bacterium]
MAGVSTKQLRTRIRSMRSTRQITKAMEMVASAKLRRAQAQAVAVKPYFETLYGVIQDISGSNRDFSSPYLKTTEGVKPLYMVIAGDRGLAGGYNNNLFKLVQSRIYDGNACVLPVGRKAEEYFRIHGIQIAEIAYTQTAEVTIGDCFTLSKELCKLFRDGVYDQVHIAYTDFASVLSQQPSIRQILPLNTPQGDRKSGAVTLYEPSGEEVFETIIPEYVGGILYGGLCESRASEHAARRNAMDAATKNADEMIADLSLQYNRARQASITQEITEIVAGAKRS